MNKEIGIGILDLYTQEDLQNCWDSIPEQYKPHVFVVSNNKNKPLPDAQTKQYSAPTQLATMRNWLISQMRLKGLKYYFLIHSNQIIKDPNMFEKTLKFADTFGTWVITGASTDNIPLEDDEKGITLNLSKHLNTQFLFLFSGIVKTFGYFDERYFNSLQLDVLDYITKIRNKNAYPPNNYHPTIPNDWLESGIGNINKLDFRDMPDESRDVQLSYAYFLNQHKYLPTQNDPTHVSQDELLKAMEVIQINYAKK
jgi:hypothetical protein